MKMRFVAFALCIMMAFAALSGVMCHAAEADTSSTAKAEYEIVESGAPALSYHNLRYYGGLVTRWFGSFTKAVPVEPLDEDGNEKPILIAYAEDETMYTASLLMVCLVAYLLGSINFATFISGRKYKDDVRNHGSGNAGMTNMLRTYGKKAAAMTLLGDMFKAIVAVLIGVLLVGDQGGYFAGIFCIFGHAYPLYYRFKGGKGVACTAAVVLMLEPLIFLIIFAIFVFVFLLTKYVSLASIMAMLFYPVALSRFYPVTHQDLAIAGNALPVYAAVISILTACFVIFLHRSNIKRLYNKEERKTVLFKKKKKEQKTENI